MQTRCAFPLILVSVLLAACNTTSRRNDTVPPLPNEENTALSIKIQYLNKVIRENPRVPEYYYRRSKLNLEAGRENAAFRDITQAIDRSSAYPKFFYLKAKILAARGEIEQAFTEASKAWDRGYQYPAVQVLLGKLNYQLGNEHEALDNLIAARSAMPEDYEIAFFLGSIYADVQDTAQAKVLLKEAIDLAPSYIASYNRLMQVFNQYEEFNNTMMYAQRGLSSGKPDGDFYVLLGNAVEKVHRIDSAVYWYQKALNNNREMWEPSIKMARYHLRNQNFLLSESYYQNALGQKPDIENGYYELAYLYEYHLDNLDGALKAYKMAAEIDSTNTSLNWYIRRVIRKINFREFQDSF